MTKSKLVDSNRRTHAAKVLVETSKKNQAAGTHETVSSGGSKKGVDALTGQFRLIRQDILKLRTDLAHGYDLVREWVETKISRRNLIKSK